MKILSTAFIFILLFSTSAFSIDKEPKLEYSFLINEQKHDIEIGKEYEIKGTFNNPIISLVAKSYRHFAYGGVEFNYPAYFTWNIKEEKNLFKQWILSGRGIQIHYLLMHGELPFDGYLDALVAQYGKENCDIDKIEYDINGKSYKGKKLKVRLAGVLLVQDILKIPANNATKFLIFFNKSYNIHDVLNNCA